MVARCRIPRHAQFDSFVSRDKPYGVIDFAFTTKDEEFPELPAIRERLSETGTGISYSDPQDGGRLTPEGLELRWRVTFPTGAERGSVPFWCHDVTPRQRRVPVTSANSTHPCGALGMGRIQLQVGKGSVSGLAEAFAAIVDKDLSGDGRYEIGVPHDKSTNKPSIRIAAADADGRNGRNDQKLALVIRSPRDLPALHHHIGDAVISILFEQVT